MPARTPDVVVLVPGLLGFSRIGNFYYFAERVVGALRGALEQLLGRAVPVVPCTTMPAGELAARQKAVLAALGRLDDLLGGVERFHLVGHSAGGVDAQLLTCDRPIRGEWQTVHRIRERIASVVALASPQHGTCLATGAAAQFMLRPVRNLKALTTVGRVLFDLVRRKAVDPNIVPLIAGVSTSPLEASKFLLQLTEHRELIGELSPESMGALRSRCKPEGRVPLTSFVTATSPRGDGRPDPLFSDLRELTAKCPPDPSPVLAAAASLLNERPPATIRSEKAVVPTIDQTTNDGLVNSVRQILDPTIPSELGALVIADHGDVIGHYDRRDALLPGPPLNSGLFHSGAGFGDDQFYALQGSITRAIAASSR